MGMIGSLIQARATREAAVAPLSRTLARIVGTIRAIEGVWIVPVALATAVPPTSRGWIGATLVVFAGWAGTFAYVAFTRGLTTWLVTFDVAVTVAICLAHGKLVPLLRIGDGTGWVAALASLCVMSLPLAWRIGRTLPAGLVVVAAYLAGFALAGHPQLGRTHGALMVGQLVLAAALMGLVRRAAQTAEATLAAAHEARRGAAVERAALADKGEQLRMVHDTALTTLTLVGTGSIGVWSEVLGARAARDLAIIEGMGTAAPGAPGAAGLTVPLDEVLTDLLSGRSRGLLVTPELAPCRVPAQVGAAFAGAVEEALLNVSRHALVDRADLSLTSTDGAVRVEIRDRGRGFDPVDVPPHRFGVRESIIGRMASAGGRATVASDPGDGTRWILEWPHAV